MSLRENSSVPAAPAWELVMLERFPRSYVYSFPERGPGAALGTETVCLGPGGLPGNPARIGPWYWLDAYKMCSLP